MNLWCQEHECTHSFQTGEIERVIYALLLGLAYEESNDSIVEYGHDSPVRCPKEALIWANATDVYKEDVDAYVTRRRAAE